MTLLAARWAAFLLLEESPLPEPSFEEVRLGKRSSSRTVSSAGERMSLTGVMAVACSRLMPIADRLLLRSVAGSLDESRCIAMGFWLRRPSAEDVESCCGYSGEVRGSENAFTVAYRSWFVPGRYRILLRFCTEF